MTTDVFDIAYNRISTSYAAVNAGAVPIGPIITAIMDMIQLIMGNCPAPAPTPAQLQTMAKNPTNGSRFMVRKAARQILVEQFGPLGFFTHNGPGCVETIFHVGANSSPEEIEAFASQS